MTITELESGHAGNLLRRWHWSGYDCSGDLTQTEPLLRAMLQGVSDSGACSRQQSVEQFLPHGLTLVLILAESHFIVSTWPEYRFASVDIGICSADVSIKKLTQPLCDFLNAQRHDSEIKNTLIGL